MALISRVSDNCYCAFCKSKRRIYVKKHIDLVNIILTMILAASLSAGFWSGVDPRAIGILSAGLGIAEIFIYLRWRFFIVCSMCGFDPVIYRRSPEKARAK